MLKKHHYSTLKKEHVKEHQLHKHQLQHLTEQHKQHIGMHLK